MSSILKALKKLEKETPSLQTRPFRLDQDQTPKAGYGRLRQSWITPGRLYIIGTLVLLTAVGSFVAVSWNAVSEKETPARRLGKSLPLKKATVPTALPAKKTLPVFDEKSFQNLDQASEKTESLVRPLIDAASSAEKSSELRPEVRADQQSPGEHKANAIKAEKDSQAETVDAENVLNDPGVKLQAISWSEQAEKRLTVINNHIAHQGDRIGGYVVVEINPNDVIVSRGAENWKIEFKSR